MRAPGGPDVAVDDVLLAVENVSLAFGGVKAVSDVSFDIRKGEIRAIIGPNGAGKTSMLNLINGFYQPQEGRITFKGEARAKMRPKDRPLENDFVTDDAFAGMLLAWFGNIVPHQRSSPLAVRSMNRLLSSKCAFWVTAIRLGSTAVRFLGLNPPQRLSITVVFSVSSLRNSET